MPGTDAVRVTDPVLSQDAAIVLALADTAVPYACSIEDEAERWVRVLRVHGQVGRALQSLGVGEARSATEPADLHTLAEEDFLKRLSAHLERNVGHGKIGKLIVVAPPRAIGFLRRAFSPALRKVVRQEVEKDYVNMPIYEVERRLSQHLAG